VPGVAGDDQPGREVRAALEDVDGARPVEVATFGIGVEPIAFGALQRLA
jgi:uncharacterized protein (DUF2141 family)